MSRRKWEHDDERHHFTSPTINEITQLLPTWYTSHSPSNNALAPILILPAFHLRRQLPRRRPRLSLTEILLRPRPQSLHATDVQIPHPRDGAHRRPRRKANQQSRGRARRNDAGIRFARPDAEQHQEAKRYGNVQGQEACDEFACERTEDEDTGEFSCCAMLVLGGEVEMCLELGFADEL